MLREEPHLGPEPSDTTEPDGVERDLAGALHEVSNALTVVLGWLEAAREQVHETAPARRAIDIAWSRAQLGRTLARRAIGADGSDRDEESELELLAKDAITGVEREAEKKQIKLVLHKAAGDEFHIVRAAPSLLQILTNLLLNSISMSPAGSTVTLEVGGDYEDALLSVQDEGPGIAEHRRPTLFQAGKSSRAGGAGVGLKHAYALAHQAGGALRLASSAYGARFDIQWPLAVRPSRLPRAPSYSEALSGLRVLLVEDDDAVIGLISTALELRGAEVWAARTQEELHNLSHTVFDAALLDLSPIAGDVAGALRSLQCNSPDAKLVLISGSAAEVPLAARGATSAWVRKPFEVSEIVDLLGNIERARRPS